MSVLNVLETALMRLEPDTREYAEHVIREWIRNLPTAIAVVEALEMKAVARRRLRETPEPSAALLREATRLEAAANRVIRALEIPPDAVFGGENDFFKWLGGDDGREQKK